MNLEHLKKSVDQLVQLEPVACQLDENGKELEAINDDWLVREVRSEVIRIDNMRTSHVAKLGKDHIHHYTSNPNRREGGYKYGFLTLHVQIFLQGVNLWIRPNSKPGARVSPYHESPISVATTETGHPFGLPNSTLRVMEELSKHGSVWSGTPPLFNRFAARAIYGAEFGDLLDSPVDYYSGLILGGYISIVSLTDHGNKSDGTPDTTMTIQLTPKAYDALGQSNSLSTDVRQNSSRAD